MSQSYRQWCTSMIEIYYWKWNWSFMSLFQFHFHINFLSLVKNCNHKRLGIYYLLSGFIFGIFGTLISIFIRIELYSSGNRIISPENQNFYNITITLHGFLMIFFLVMPTLFGGFGNYFLLIFQAHSLISRSKCLEDIFSWQCFY